MLGCACVVHRWIWLRRPFGASPRVDRVLACEWHCLPLYVGREVVYPARRPLCFLIVVALRPPRRIRATACASGNFWLGARVPIPRLPGPQSIYRLADLDQLEAAVVFSSGFLQWL